MALVDKIYLVDEKHRHLSVKNEYLHVKKVTGSNMQFKVLYCDICKKYMIPRNKFEMNYKGKINDNMFVIADGKTFITDTSFKSEELGDIIINKLECFKKEHLDHILCEKKLKYKNEEFKTVYCKDCDCYGVEENQYNNIKNNRKLNYVHEETKIINSNPLNNLNDSIEFLIRINTFRCNVRKHNIEEITAVINVFNKRKNVLEEVEINAFYCKNCNLYFIYENEYNRLYAHGIPICPIHEELKFYNKSKDFESYNTESLLRQFGYNVNAQENLSSLERHKIIEMILEHGFMNKSEILSHLTFLSNSRKNITNMANAVSKWNEDISFVNNLKSKKNRIVMVGAFRKYIHKKKKN